MQLDTRSFLKNENFRNTHETDEYGITIIPNSYADNRTNTFSLQPKQYLFGYGSLINAKSRNKTVTTNLSAIPAIPAIVSNFTRSWSYRCPKKHYTAVSVSRTTDMNDKINGVLIPLSNPKDELQMFDSRELNYARGIIPLNHISTLANVELDPNSIVWIYETPNSITQNHSTTSQACASDNHSPSHHCPIPQSYIDCILSGCLSYSAEFAKLFLATTRGLAVEYLINDRHQKYIEIDDSFCEVVDGLLVEFLPLQIKSNL